MPSRDFFAYDKCEYDDWRGFCYDFDGMTSGSEAHAMDALAALLASVGVWFHPDEVRLFRGKFMSACDEHAVERIARAALESEGAA